MWSPEEIHGWRAQPYWQKKDQMKYGLQHKTLWAQGMKSPGIGTEKKKSEKGRGHPGIEPGTSRKRFTRLGLGCDPKRESYH